MRLIIEMLLKKLITKLNNLSNNINKLFEKYFFFILLFLVCLTYFPYISVISWGEDYAGYILQAKAMFSNGSNEFIEKQKFLQPLSINPRFPIYAPIGLPLLIGLTSFITNFEIYLVKLLIPLSVLLISLALRSKSSNLIILLLAIHPSVTDQYTDILGEIPAILFFIYAINSKNYYLKNILFVITCLIKPTFFIFVVFVILFSSKQKIKDYFVFGICLFLFELFSRSLFSMQIFGDYSQINTNTVNQGLISRSLDNFFNLTFSRFIFFLEEIGIMVIGFSNILSPLIGFLFILLLLFLRNRYSVMCLAFMLFHFFVIEVDYFVRYLFPVLFFTFLSLREYLLTKKGSKNLSQIVFITFFLFFGLQNIYSILNIDLQRGPHETSSIELFEYVENFDKNTIFGFHSPRPFRLLSEKDAYKLDGELYKNSVVICYKDQQCTIPKDYELVFNNIDYKVFNK